MVRAIDFDHEDSGATQGPMIGHVAPEASAGEPIGLLKEGDTITIDISEQTLTVDVDRKNVEEWSSLDAPTSMNDPRSRTKVA